ncbi:MAG: tetratricopeptide repeat protein, partial [Myxococcales bacterium]|nr:tetratricopeptide repeat protein [Myxococcales bacterium]
MRRRADRGDRRYLLRFGVTALLLISGTLVLVLYVLPERYVLESGFRESGMSFPTPSTPFVPIPAVQVAARPVPTPPAVIIPGPAEAFWDELTPLLEQQRYEEALFDFEEYLRAYPSDRDARREYIVTLLATERVGEATAELRRLLDEGDDYDQRLLLARTLRDLGRVDEAGEEYRRLTATRPDDVALWLEWARAHAWIEQFDEAAEVLEEALDRHPGSVPLRIELARVEFSRDGLERAAGLLAGIGEAELASNDAVELRDAVAAALVVPDPIVEPIPEPTLLERAVQAREADDFEQARALFGAALAERPDDLETWQAYADFLEYEQADFEGARAALLEVERLGPESVALQYRLAQLEIWTERNDEARRRLHALLPVVVSDPEAAAPVTTADVHAMLGDLERWAGDRPAAGREYELALADDPGHERALDGMEALDAEIARTVLEVEQPRVAAV